MKGSKLTIAGRVVGLMTAGAALALPATAPAQVACGDVIHRNRDPDPNPNGHRNPHADGDGHANGDTDVDAHVHRHADADGDPDGHGDGDADDHCNADGERQSNTDGRRRHQVRAAKELSDQTPGTCDRAAPLNPSGPCLDDTDCGGAAGSCQRPKLRKDLQAFFEDELDDCALNRDGGVSLPGQPAEGMCLFDLRKPRELCNPVDKSAVVAPREGHDVAVISGSTATTSASLLCYQAKLASKFANATVAALGGAAVGDKLVPKQAKHLKRRVKDGNPIYIAPGNLFPVPTIVDTSGQAMVCVPTDVISVTALP